MMLRNVCVFLCLLMSFSYADQPTYAEYMEGEVLIRFSSKEETKLRTLSEKQVFLKNKLGNAKIKKQYHHMPSLALVELPAGVKVADAIKSLRHNDEILYIEPNYRVYAQAIPTDPYFPNQWGLHNTGQSTFEDEYGQTVYATPDADIDAPEAWDIYTGSQEIIVAVIDTGIDYKHPDLAANMWINYLEFIGNLNSDDDGNGFKDDIYGYDFRNGDNDPNDDNYHGTHVAGTIGAVGDNGVGVAGVSWNVKVMALKFLDSGGSGYIADAIKCIEYAIDNGAKILNNSWGGGGYSQSIKDIIEYANQNGVLFIAAAGNYRMGEATVNNDIAPSYPSSYAIDNIVSVLATDYRDERPWWSHYGNNTVDIGAPGVDIFSTFPSYVTGSMFGFSTFYEAISGTSMAAPHVSGACALVWSMYPHLQARDVKRIILETADPLASLQGLCVTEGRLNVYQALLAACPISLELATDITPPDDCVEPEDVFSYTLTCFNPTPTDSSDPNYFGPATNVSVTLYLPEAITCPQGLWSLDPNFTPLPPDPGYDSETHAYTWPAFDLSPGQTVTLELDVQVNSKADPSGYLTAQAVLRADNAYTIDTDETPVCCYDTSGIIYVDARATGYNTGIGWQNAYTDFNRALQRAGRTCGSEIRIAQGIYYPGENASDTFAIPDGITVYGGFAGRGLTPDERNPTLYRTLLSGRIDEDQRNDVVVTTGEGVLLDGLQICDGTTGVSGRNVDVFISDCEIVDHTYDGIYHEGNYTKTIVVDNCKILNNGQNGLYSEFSIPQVYNSQINLNGSESSTSYGLNLLYPKAGTVVRNNTLAYNANQGIRTVDPNTLTIRNCILWGNLLSDDQEQITGDVSAYYSCVYDYNNPYQTTPDPVWHNISCDPQFAYDSDPNATVFHLLPNSPCIDRSDPSLSYDNQFDIDNESRVMGVYVDMGADEIDPSCNDVFNPWDRNADGLVNLYEFARLTKAWLSHDSDDPAITDPNHPDHDYLTDPNSTGYVTSGQFAVWESTGQYFNFSTTGQSAYAIDLADLLVFVEDSPWLWIACWRTDLLQQQMMAMMSALPESSGLELLSSRSNISLTEQIKTVEPRTFDTERAAMVRLLRKVDDFIADGGEAAPAWSEMKQLLQNALLETFDVETQVEEY